VVELVRPMPEQAEHMPAGSLNEKAFA